MKKFLFLFGLLGFSCLGWAQRTVTVASKNEPLSRVIQILENQSGMLFVVNDEVDTNRKVSVDLKDVYLNDALNQIFTPIGVQYAIQDKHIVLSNKPMQKSTFTPSQHLTASGVVTDATGEPAIGASVIIKGSTTGTITDFEGQFSLETKEGDVLVISYVGYKTEEMKAGENLRIALMEDNELLEEVVVVGYGTQKKVNLTGAVSVVDPAESGNRPTTSAAQILQGLDPGLNIGISSGLPNADYTVDIRGAASISSGVEPLVLVDGVEMSLNRVNPSDIESVSILKDASASAIYGAQASAGVVLITTKSGKEGRAQISYNGRFGMATNTTSTDYITTGYDWVRITDQFYATRFGVGYTKYTESDYQELQARINDKTEDPSRPWVVAQPDGSYKYYANFDWYNYLYKNKRPQHEHNLTIKGGNDKINYYVSGKYSHVDGIMRLQNNTYDVATFRAKLNAELRRWLHYSLNVSYFHDKSWWPGMKSIQTTFRNVTFGGGAYVPATNPDGSIVHMQTYTNQSAPVLNGMNLLLTGGNTSNSSTNDEMVLKNAFDFDIYKGLQAHINYALKWHSDLDQYRYANATYSDHVGVYTTKTDSYCRDEYIEQRKNSYQHQLEAYFDYAWSGKGHSVKALLGTQYQYFHQKKQSASQYNLLSQKLSDFDLAVGETMSITGGYGAYQTLGFFGRVNYDYNGRYLFEFSARGDGSSRFPKKSRWGFFPSGSVGWRMSEESWWEPLSEYWSNSKLRASIGSLGNQQVGYYDYFEQITSYSTSDYSIDGSSPLNYIRESDPVANNLTWETVTTYDLGVDWGFFRNRLNVTFDGYTRDTKDMLVAGMTLPAVYGANVPKMNSGDMRTMGWELAVSWAETRKVCGKPMSYKVHASVGDYKTKITRFVGNDTKLITDYYEGMTLGEIWGFRTDGLFKSDDEASTYTKNVCDQTLVGGYIEGSVGNNKGWRAGDLKYIDVNGNGKLDIGNNTADNAGDREVIGNSLPRYSYNFGGNWSWYGVDISILFQGVGRRDWSPTMQSSDGGVQLFWGPYARPHNTFLSQQLIDNMWSETNPDGYFPRARGYEAYGSGMHTLNTANDRYLQNAAYLRFKNLTIGYTFPIPKRILEQLRLYVSAENLAYWSPMKKYCKYIDPESVFSKTSYLDGTGEVYNFSATFSIGLDITF